MEQNKNNQPENENNENVPMPDYKKLYEEQVVNLNDAKDCISCLQKENEELRSNLENTEEELKQKNKYHLQYYRQADILKKTLKAIIEKHDLKMGDVYELMFETNEMDMDTLLLNLSK